MSVWADELDLHQRPTVPVEVSLIFTTTIFIPGEQAIRVTNLGPPDDGIEPSGLRYSEEVTLIFTTWSFQRTLIENLMNF